MRISGKQLFALLSAILLSAQTSASSLDDIAAQLGNTMSELSALDTADKKIAQSNAAQIESSKMLARERDRFKTDLQALQSEATALDQLRAQIVASGCPDSPVPVVVDLALAQRCNPMIERHTRGHNAAMAKLTELQTRKATLDQLETDISNTTLDNARKTKDNNARRADLLAQKAQLQEAAILNVVKSKRALALRACGADRCCQSVVYDGASPRTCGIGLICSRFSAAGMFGTGRRICDVAPSSQPLRYKP